MKYEVIITKSASEDLIGIHEYIHEALVAPQTAKNQLLRIKKAIDSLDFMPERFRLYNQKLDATLRSMIVDNYCVFFDINTEKNMVIVHHIYYASRDLDKAMFLS